jgi:hypothetical protein
MADSVVKPREPKRFAVASSRLRQPASAPVQPHPARGGDETAGYYHAVEAPR